MCISPSVEGSSDASLVDNKWHHVATVWDGDSCQLTLYKDGSLIASQDMTAQCNVTLSPAATLDIGTATTAGDLQLILDVLSQGSHSL